MVDFGDRERLLLSSIVTWPTMLEFAWRQAKMSIVKVHELHILCQVERWISTEMYEKISNQNNHV